MNDPKTPDLAAVESKSPIDLALDNLREAWAGLYPENGGWSRVRTIIRNALSADAAQLVSVNVTQAETIAKLRAELEARVYVSAECERRGDELSDLRERLAGAEADARRMDWMQRHHASIWWGGVLERRKGNDPDAVALEWLDAGATIEQSERFRTLREAIDAALLARGGDRR